MLRQFAGITKKLFPARGNKLNEKLQSMYDEAVAFAEQSKNKQALEGFTAVLNESVKSNDWADQRVTDIIPAIVGLLDAYEPARATVLALIDERERQMRDGTADIDFVREWCTLLRGLDADRVLLFYDELKQKWPYNPVLAHIKNCEDELFVNNRRYADYTADDLRNRFNSLKALVFQINTEKNNTDPAGSDDAEETEEADDGYSMYDAYVVVLELSASLLFQASLGSGNEEFAESTYKLMMDTVPTAQTYALLIRSAETVPSEIWPDRLLKDAKAKLSPAEFRELGKLREEAY